MVRSLSPKAALLIAPEGRNLVGNDALVDADDAAFDRLGDAPDTPHVPGIEIGGEAKRRSVGHGDDIDLGFEAEQRGHGTEGLLARNEHVLRHIGEYRRFIEVAPAFEALAANHYLGTFGPRVGNMLLHLLHGG